MDHSWRDNKPRFTFRRLSAGTVRSGGKLSWKKILFSKKLWLAAGLLSLAGLVFVTASFAWLSRSLPNPNQLIERQIAQSTKIYDRTGENILYDIHGDEQRTLVELKDIPNYVKWATISIEDKNFYEHKGFSLWAIIRTMVTNVLHNKRAGASTLTQQFIKNAVLSNEKTYTRKIKELILAYKLEKQFSKDQILQMYLNEIPYGSTAYGIEAASRRYFGKSVKDITLSEAAVLAAIPQAPSYYSPYSGHKDALLTRQKYVLTLMADQGYITKEAAEEAKAAEIKFAPPTANITAPHFVMYVKEMLTEKYGQKTVEQGGLKIYTTLDLYKQKIAEEVINNWWEKNKEVDKKTNVENKYNKFGASNAALVSIDPKTGQVLALVGSRDYFNDDIDGQVNIATALRQPGSSLKPLVYGTLFTKGYTPNSILYDVVTNFSTDKQKPYEPKNFNLKEYGPIKIRQALAGSLNVPAVAATYLANLDDVLALAKKFGYTSLEDKERFGMSFALGGAEVQMLEHVNGYGVFAREGKYHPVTAILKVEDKNGKVLEEWQPQETDVLDANVAKEVTDILSDNSARAFMFGEQNPLTLGKRPVAAKTGTTNDYHDAWTMGYTPSLVAGVWVGNSDNTAMKKGASAANAAGPIWHDYMARVLGDTPIETFNKPEIKKTGKPILDGELPNQTVKIDKVTRLLATENTPPEMIEELSFNEHHCVLYYIDKDDPLGPPPADPAKDPQFKNWEEAVQKWAQKMAASSSATFSTGTAPTAFDYLHTPENRPTVEIISPKNNDIISGKYLNVEIRANAPRGVVRAQYYINDNLIVEKEGSFLNLTDEQIDFLPNGYQNLKVRVCDDVYNCSSAALEFNLLLDEERPSREFSATITWPQSGLALSAMDYPVNIKFELDNPKQAARIDVYAKHGDQSIKLGTINPAGKQDTAFTWARPKENGEYRIFGKAYGWSGDSKNTNEVILNVQ